MQVRFVQALKTAKVVVELRAYGFEEPYEATHYSSRRCFLDFAVSPRPKPSRGRYEEYWQPNHTEAIGDIMFVPAGMRMRGSCAAGEQRALSCYFDPTLFEIDFSRLDDGALSESLHLDGGPIRLNLARMLREAHRPNLATPLALEALASLLAVDIARSLSRCQATPGPKRGGLSGAHLRLIEERIRSQAPLPTLSELAAECNLSTRHLARAFRQETGRTVGQMVAAAGAERALALLADDRLAVKEVAGLLGFASASSFSSAFRRATGRRPSDVRKAPLV